MPCSSPAKPPIAVSDNANDQDQVADRASNHNSPSVDTTTDTVKSGDELEEQDPKQVLEQPPLPDEQPPPLPDEEPPNATEDDGWEPVWDETAQSFYFYNRVTQVSQWENPRVPEKSQNDKSGVEDTGPPGTIGQGAARKSAAGGYDPAIHGDYDPNADYAKVYEPQHQLGQTEQSVTDPTTAYAATAAFNRFTGKWQSADLNPDKFSDENKSKRQMNAFFDVDAAANAHDGRSLRAERSNKKISKQELKAYREKRREKKEEKKRAWLRD